MITHLYPRQLKSLLVSIYKFALVNAEFFYHPRITFLGHCAGMIQYQCKQHQRKQPCVEDKMANLVANIVKNPRFLQNFASLR